VRVACRHWVTSLRLLREPGRRTVNGSRWWWFRRLRRAGWRAVDRGWRSRLGQGARRRLRLGWSRRLPQLSEEAIHLCRAQPVGQIIGSRVDSAFEQNFARIVGEAAAQSRVLPKPRNELRHRERLASGSESARGARAAQKRREQTSHRFEKRTDGDCHDQPSRYCCNQTLNLRIWHIRQETRQRLPSRCRRS
jgi:hypothetical protein